jgi:hypothetical protein
MAATIARATGYDASRVKETHRLGSQSSTAQANTWQTFTTAHVNRDGSGYVEVSRNGETLIRAAFGPEDAPLSLDWQTVAVDRIEGLAI